jgi:hypothetical protein
LSALLLGNYGLGRVKALSYTPEVQLFRDGDEVSELTKLHP